MSRAKRPLSIVRRTALCLLASVLIGVLAGSVVSARQAGGIDFMSESATDRDLRMAWWREARFGMFIHWGLYAIPAGSWKGQRIPGIGEWIMASANIPVSEYAPLAKQFNPTKFDAARWVALAKSAGMKYIVITSKHHDGFSLWDSKISDYDIVDSTPYGKDVLAALTLECRRQGIKMCFYHSILDWHHPSQYVDPKAKDFRAGHANNKIHPEMKDEYVRYLKGQLKELILNYDPAVLWFDGEWADWWTEPDGKDLYNYVRSLKNDIIVNNRVGKGRRGMQGLNKGPGYSGDFGTPEQEIPSTGQPGVDWESCMTINDTWGYKSFDENWKSTRTLIRNLVDITSKGGNYLLNIGPMADGTIPAPIVQRLDEMGAWMKVNGESIYQTSASPFTKPDWGRYTKKPGVLYAHIFEWPANGQLRIPQIKQKVTMVSLLDHGGARALKFSLSPTYIQIDLPEKAPNAIDSVIRLDLATW